MAQRLANIAAPGSLLKGSVPAKGKKRSDMGRSPREHDDGHLEAVRQCACLKCGMDPAGVAAHVRMASAAHGKRSGISEKPSDCWTVPLCASCHDEQHKLGEREFWEALGLNPLLICEALHRASPNTEAMRAIVFASQAIGATS